MIMASVSLASCEQKAIEQEPPADNAPKVLIAPEYSAPSGFIDEGERYVYTDYGVLMIFHGDSLKRVLTANTLVTKKNNFLFCYIYSEQGYYLSYSAEITEGESERMDVYVLDCKCKEGAYHKKDPKPDDVSKRSMYTKGRFLYILGAASEIFAIL